MWFNSLVNRFNSPRVYLTNSSSTKTSPSIQQSFLNPFCKIQFWMNYVGFSSNRNITISLFWKSTHWRMWCLNLGPKLWGLWTYTILLCMYTILSYVWVHVQNCFPVSADWTWNEKSKTDHLCKLLLWVFTVCFQNKKWDNRDSATGINCYFSFCWPARNKQAKVQNVGKPRLVGSTHTSYILVASF